MDWFRSYHGAPFDPKWRLIANRTKCRTGEVAAVFWAILDIASSSMKRGVTHGNIAERMKRCETIAAALDFETPLVVSIYEGLETLQVIVDGRLAAWEKRQPKREDNSTERVRKFRRNAMKRNETHGNAREREEIREIEEEKKPHIHSTRASRLGNDFEVPPEWLTAAAERRRSARLPEVNLKAEAIKFVAHARGIARESFNWQDAFTQWCMKADPGKLNGANGHGVQPVERKPKNMVVDSPEWIAAKARGDV